MKDILLSLLIGSACIVPSALAQSTARNSSATAQEDKEEREARNGVAFVVSASGGVALPSNRLYYEKSKGTYDSIEVSNRIVSKRVPLRGTVKFWAENPSGANGDKVPPPLFSVNIPSGTRPICILIPFKAKDSDKISVSNIALAESQIPPSGQHIINLSPYPLTMMVASKSDFSDAKKFKIPANAVAGGRGIQKENIWSFKGTSGEVVSFMLSAQLKPSAEPIRVRASRFTISDKQSQVNLIIKDPNRDGVRMETVQIAAPKPTTPASGRNR